MYFPISGVTANPLFLAAIGFVVGILGGVFVCLIVTGVCVGSILHTAVVHNFVLGGPLREAILGFLLPPLLGIAAGIYVCRVIVRMDTQSLRSKLARDDGQGPAICQECGYDLTGNVSGVCPECGTEIES